MVESQNSDLQTEPSDLAGVLLSSHVWKLESGEGSGVCLKKKKKKKILGRRHTTESNGRSATFEVMKRKTFLEGTDTSTLVEIYHRHGTQGQKKKKNIKQKQH